MAREFIDDARPVVAKRMDVEDVPAWQVKTTLQRTVQALKRHRDMHFADAPEGQAGLDHHHHARRPGLPRAGTLYEVLVDVTERMPASSRAATASTGSPNPVQPEENFADRWRTHPGRDAAVLRLDRAGPADFTGYGADRVGPRPRRHKDRRDLRPDRSANRAGERLGTGMRHARGRGLPQWPPVPVSRGRSAAVRPSGRCRSTRSTASLPERRGRSLARQAFACTPRSRRRKTSSPHDRFTWTDTLQPTELSRVYTVRIT